MSQSWSFQKLLPVKPEPLLKAYAPSPPSFSPQQATVGLPEKQYPVFHLLGAPLEIRRQVWQAITQDVLQNPSGKWFAKPTTEYDNLLLVCRQLFHEITAEYWPLAVVTPNRTPAFLGQTLSFSRLAGFRFLSIQVPFNFGDYGHLACALLKLAPYMQELRLFFCGSDNYGFQTRLHGCGNLQPGAASTSQKLLIDGQDWRRRLPLMKSLASLRQLRSLVLSNINMPLLQSVLMLHKPKLEKLHISADPRTTLHLQYK